MKNMLETLHYIEENLSNKITTESMATYANYSMYHYARLFKREMGMTLNEYVTQRRLTCAAKDILGGHKILDVALRYGYETHAGFVKAFKQRFGYPPSLLHALRLSQILFSHEGGLVMDVKRLLTELMTESQTRYTQDQVDLIRKAYEIAEKAHENQKRYS